MYKYKIKHKEFYYQTVLGDKKLRSRVVYTLITADSESDAIKKLDRDKKLILRIDFLGKKKEDIFGAWFDTWSNKAKDRDKNLAYRVRMNKLSKDCND